MAIVVSSMLSLRFQIIYSFSENYEIRTAPGLGLRRPRAVKEVYLTQNIILVINRGAHCLVNMWGVLAGTSLFTAFCIDYAGNHRPTLTMFEHLYMVESHEPLTHRVL